MKLNKNGLKNVLALYCMVAAIVLTGYSFIKITDIYGAKGALVEFVLIFIAILTTATVTTYNDGAEK